MKHLKIIFTSILLVAVAMMNACKKDSPVENYPYEVRMTDAPGKYDAVFVDVIGVEVTGGDGKTVALNIHSGIYNLLNFTNGLDTLIATSTLHSATVEQIRLILGPNNSVVVKGVSYPLATPSAEQSGLKLQVHQSLQAGVLYSVLLDFDANKSITETGSGTYKLKPVIRTIEKAFSGSINGFIAPANTYVMVTAVSSNNVSFTTIANPDGYFLLSGIPTGTYTVILNPDAPLNSITITDVKVSIGVATQLGPIRL